MPLPTSLRAEPDDSGKIFLIALKDTSFLEGMRLESELPQYEMGAFSSSLDAHRVCVRLNQRLWKAKEYAFRANNNRSIRTLLQRLRFTEAMTAETAEQLRETEQKLRLIKYNQRARRRDQELSHYHVVPIDLNNHVAALATMKAVS